MKSASNSLPDLPGWLSRPGVVIKAVAVSFALLITTWLVQYWSYRQDVVARDRMDQTQAVLERTLKMRSRLSEAGMAIRGYVLTGDDRYLKVVADATNNFEGLLNSTHALALSNATHRECFARLEPFVHEYLRLLGVELARPPLSPPAAALVAERQLAITDLRDRMRDIFGEVLREQEQRLTEQAAEVQKRGQVAQSSVLGGGVLALGLMAVVSWALIRQNRVRERAEARLKMANADLERLVDERTAILRVNV